MDVTPNRSQHQIKNGAILLTYIGLPTMGKPAYEPAHEFDDDPDFYKYALGIVRSIPSEETMRQRMDDIGSSLRSYILAENISSSGITALCRENFPMVMCRWISMSHREVIGLYHAHDECGQFHSEIKTDMDLV